MKLCVTQPRLCYAIQRRRRDHAAKGAVHAIALVISHDEQDVGRALEWHHPRRPVGLGIFGIFLDYTAELGLRRRELIPADGGRGAGRTGRAGGLYLCSNGSRSRHDGDSEHPANDDLSY